MPKKKKGVAVIIAVQPPGGKAPKGPTETSKVGVKGKDCPSCGLQKAMCKCMTKANMGNCPVCGMHGVLPCAICQRPALRRDGA